jgi:hypothetical protein
MILAILVLVVSVVALVASLVMAARGERGTGAVVAGAVAFIGMAVGIFVWLGYGYFSLLVLGLIAIILGLLARREGGSATAGIALGVLATILFIAVATQF